jgi:hypothetical protein
MLHADGFFRAELAIVEEFSEWWEAHRPAAAVSSRDVWPGNRGEASGKRLLLERAALHGLVERTVRDGLRRYSLAPSDRPATSGKEIEPCCEK